MKQKEHVPLALHASGFKSAEEVRSVIKRLQKKSCTPEESWARATDHMLVKHGVPLNPQLKPDRNTWRLLSFIASMTKDDELGQLAKAQLEEADDFY